ncbi:TrkH family potassium uptake protein [Salisediminibacterium halotolerans]|uniref:Trk-type K+ transport system, membrane component n=1 Tax=Salisediminibacterium halotolerans TaxID=517425 RepID=A0A1H9U2N8_9BACI|nr:MULTISPECIES: TrkH family potassium uptake protein [Salisediminibacterium]RLJ81121.1 Trk-type K+ transport system membrane component [Actinophytocola xinjiangensis]RPE84070.1 Trk-type K+ transport system membrane component [Salisediminibacterium halotolerans]TWG38548.1 Trk-type K+ transport system membrane component [Salisediminibacterium halotolerans]SES03434.1 Trk-type K+ transport system, membrane component [Salisediminibacterium haloalkalitolerans]GEL07176.1 Ktr system potassium uptake 
MKFGMNKLLTPFRIIVLSYIIAMAVFSILLYLPVSSLPGEAVSYQEALFTAVSAVSVTGLTVVNVSETYSGAGVFFLALAIQLGGIGVMTLGTFVWMVLGQKIPLSRRMLIMVDQNQISFAGMVKLMRGILFVAIGIEVVGALILGTYYMNFFDTAQEAYYQGAFGALSAFTNAGFDVTGQSLVPFADDYFVQLVNILLIFAGAIGFPVLLEIREYFNPENKQFRFSLFTKISVSTYFIVFVIGAAGLWLMEIGAYYEGMPWHQQLFFSMFNSATARSGGLSTMDVSDLTLASLLFLSGLMIIGASPSSVGGGIRTTTLAVMFLTIRSFILGRSDVKAFGREIHQEDRQKAFIVLSVFMVGLFFAVILIAVFEQANDIALMAIVFDASSAFGTVGLSMGITDELTFASQSILMTLMLIGRVGLVAFLFSIRAQDKKTPYKHPTERIIIG